MKERRVRGGGKTERIHKYQRALDLAIALLTYRQKNNMIYLVRKWRFRGHNLNYVNGPYQDNARE